jgi:pimeloyl-ACP methyl ester carboxylesterase
MGVVLCSPLGYEAMSAHRTLRHLAERLAEHGLPTLRFDYHGTGDSSGRPDDPDRWDAWLASIRAAVAALRGRAGVQRIALCGVGFGATLAALVAPEDPDIEAFVAWAPVVNGKPLVREMRAFRMLKNPKAPPLPGGGLEMGGYFFAEPTLKAMAGADLLLVAPPAPRVLLLSRADSAAGDEQQLSDRWTKSGVEVHVEAPSGYRAMIRDDAYNSVVPEATLDSLVAWLSRVGPETRISTAPRSVRQSTLVLTAADGAARIRETPYRFGDDDRLFGVLTEPALPREGLPTVLIFNVGANPHSGPHNMNVTNARALAASGYRSFRFDFAGLGDSAAPAGVAENRLYTLDAIEDVRAAMSFLHRTCEASKFVLVGLCSGTYVAFHTAVADPRVVGQVLLSPFAFEWHEGDDAQRKFNSMSAYVRGLVDPTVWGRLLRGEINVRNIATVLAERSVARARVQLGVWLARLRGEEGPQNVIERGFRGLSDRGVETLIVLSAKEGGRDLVARYLGADGERMQSRRGFALEIVGAPDNTYTLASETTLGPILQQYMRSRFP